jgi:hypothetical protein
MATSATVRVIKDTNGAGLDALIKRLGRGEHRVLVGVPAGKTEPEGTSMAMVAAINEFGGHVAPHSRTGRQLMRRNPRTGRLMGPAETYEGMRGPGRGMQGPAQRVTKTRNANAVLQLAKHATFENGITIPARPWLRPSIYNNVRRISALGRRSLSRVARGETTLHASLELLGVYAVGLAKREIGSGETIPNAPSTIKKKGSSRPRIDSGALRQGITHVVEGKV